MISASAAGGREQGSTALAGEVSDVARMKDRDLYSIQEARERLGGISRNTIYMMLRRGQLGSVVIGCRRFISASQIAELIAKCTTTESPSEDDARARTPTGSEVPSPMAQFLWSPSIKRRR